MTRADWHRFYALLTIGALFLYIPLFYGLSKIERYREEVGRTLSKVEHYDALVEAQ